MPRAGHVVIPRPDGTRQAQPPTPAAGGRKPKSPRPPDQARARGCPACGQGFDPASGTRVRTAQGWAHSACAPGLPPLRPDAKNGSASGRGGGKPGKRGKRYGGKGKTSTAAVPDRVRGPRPPKPGEVPAPAAGTCVLCERNFRAGTALKPTEKYGLAHPACARAAKATAKIVSGVTFAGHKASGWKVGAAPSSTRTVR